MPERFFIRMLKTLKIKNFQSHKHTCLDFSEGLNVIVGESDKGKSAVLRALSMLVNNDFPGCKYFPNFMGDKGKTVVEAIFNDCKVKLEKRISKGKTKKKVRLGRYILNDIQKFESFGITIPDLVENSINIGQINFQKQHDHHYLVLDSPGNIGKEINKIIDIDLIDQWISSLNSEINENRRELRHIDAKSKNLEEKLKRYKRLDEFEIIIEEIEKITKKITQCDKKLLLLEEYNKNQSELEKYKGRLKFAAQNIEEIKKYDYDIEELDYILEKCAEYKKNICKLHESKKELESKILSYKKKLIQLKKCPVCDSDINGDLIEKILL